MAVSGKDIIRVLNLALSYPMAQLVDVARDLFAANTCRYSPIWRCKYHPANPIHPRQIVTRKQCAPPSTSS